MPPLRLPVGAKLNRTRCSLLRLSGPDGWSYSKHDFLPKRADQHGSSIREHLFGTGRSRATRDIVNIDANPQAITLPVGFVQGAQATQNISATVNLNSNAPEGTLLRRRSRSMTRLAKLTKRRSPMTKREPTRGAILYRYLLVTRVDRL